MEHRFLTGPIAGALLLGVQLLVAAPAHALTTSQSNLCAYATAAQAAALLGGTPGAPIIEGPKTDDDHPNAISTSCRLETDKRVLAIMLLDFKTGDEANSALHHDIDAVRSDPDSKFDPVSGQSLGDEAFLATEQSSATYVLRKATRLIAIGVAGEGSAEPETQPNLLALTQGVLARLPPPASMPSPSMNSGTPTH